MYQNRDFGIRQIKARRGHCCYGMGLGILILDDVYPGFPGDVRNASAYPFPIQYEIVEGVDIQCIVDMDDKSPYLNPILKAARKLERMGCRALSAECGYFAYFQKDISGFVNIPVFMSSLLQISWAQQLIGPEKVVGILTGNADKLTDSHLEAVGVKPGSNYVMKSIHKHLGESEFTNLWSTKGKRSNPPGADYQTAERQLIDVAAAFYGEQPNLGAIVFECTGYQPFARAVQREINIPIFSWGTLLDYAFSVVNHRDYFGHV